MGARRCCPQRQPRSPTRLVIGDDQAVLVGVQPVHDAEERHAGHVGRDPLFGGPDVDTGGVLKRPESVDGRPGTPAEGPLGVVVESEGLELGVVRRFRPRLSSQFPGAFDGTVRRRLGTQQFQHAVGERSQQGRFTRRVGELLYVAVAPPLGALVPGSGRGGREGAGQVGHGRRPRCRGRRDPAGRCLRPGSRGACPRRPPSGCRRARRPAWRQRLPPWSGV